MNQRIGCVVACAWLLLAGRAQGWEEFQVPHEGRLGFGASQLVVSDNVVAWMAFRDDSAFLDGYHSLIEQNLVVMEVAKAAKYQNWHISFPLLEMEGDHCAYYTYFWGGPALIGSVWTDSVIEVEYGYEPRYYRFRAMAIEGDRLYGLRYLFWSEPVVGHFFQHDLATGEQRLLEGAGFVLDDFESFLSISADGQMLAYHSHAFDEDSQWPQSDDSEIFVYDVRSDQAVAVCSAPGDQINPQIDAGVVVWEDYRDDPEGDIYGYNLLTGEEFAVCTAPGAQTKVRISDNLIVWEDGRGGDADIYGYDLLRDAELKIAVAEGDQFGPEIDAGLVAWTDDRFIPEGADSDTVAQSQAIFAAWVFSPHAGDANGDGAVTDADYTVWADNFGAQGVGWNEGDFNGDGEVTDADYTYWADGFGAGVVNTPEPATISLLAVGALALMRRRR